MLIKKLYSDDTMHKTKKGKNMVRWFVVIHMNQFSTLNRTKIFDLNTHIYLITKAEYCWISYYDGQWTCQSCRLVYCVTLFQYLQR